jgi:hypothetical protein
MTRLWAQAKLAVHQLGERYFSARIVRAMDRLMRGRRKRTTVAVPVIALRAVG